LQKLIGLLCRTDYLAGEANREQSESDNKQFTFSLFTA
jgi:hypothetical protein